MNTRQFICSVLAVGVAVGIYFALQPYVGTEEIGWMCILGAAPFAACGFFTYHGMTAEQVLWAWFKSEILCPKRLVFKSDSYYYEAMQPAIRAGMKRKEVWELTNKEFTGLMQQYQKLIYTVCLQFVHEPHTAEDLTQDTFLSAFSAIDRCEPQYYKQWLVRVAANKCKDHLKSAWVRKVDAPGDDALPEPRGAPGSDADDPAQSVADRAGAAELETLVRGLREPYGKIAVLYFLEHRETAEIAKLVGRPPATVNSQLWRAKLLLRQQITERRQNE